MLFYFQTPVFDKPLLIRGFGQFNRQYICHPSTVDLVNSYSKIFPSTGRLSLLNNPCGLPREIIMSKTVEYKTDLCHGAMMRNYSGKVNSPSNWLRHHGATLR